MNLSRAGVLAALLLGCVVGFAPVSQAATFSQTELSYDGALLSQFNLVNIGNLNVGSTNGNAVYVAGRVIAGSITTGSNGLGACVGTFAGGTSVGCSGNAANIGSGNTTTTGASALSGTAYGALTVFGNVVGAVGSTGGGASYVGGNVSGNSNAAAGSSGGNGTISGANTNTVNVVGTLGSGSIAQDTPKYTTTQSSTTRGGSLSNVSSTSYGQTLATVFPFGSEATNIQTPLKNLYAGLANLPGSPGVTAQSLPTNQTGVLTSTTAYTTVVNGTTYKYGVVTTSLSDLSKQSSSFTGIANGAGNNATFVIVTGDGATNLLPTLTNNDSKVIYDFVGASSLALAGTFNASILAPLANLNAGSNTINGTVVVASMTANNNLYNGNVFTGDLTGLTNFGYNARVPEPLSLSLFGVGVAAALITRRRRK